MPFPQKIPSILQKKINPILARVEQSMVHINFQTLKVAKVLIDPKNVNDRVLRECSSRETGFLCAFLDIFRLFKWKLDLVQKLEISVKLEIRLRFPFIVQLLCQK